MHTMAVATRLAALGYDESFEEAFAPHASVGLVPARVALEHQHIYRVYTEHDDVLARVSGRARHRWTLRADFPAVGDWVALERAPTSAVIHAVLPRHSRVMRKAAGRQVEPQVVAANLDLLFLVSGLDHDFNLRRIERYVATARESGVTPVIVLNKVDLVDDAAACVREVASVAPTVAVRLVSARKGIGLEALRDLIAPGRTIALIGSSGVGKSTIINRLLGEDRLTTREVRAADQRGRHATTHRELIELPGGGLLIDTPGMRELRLWEADEALDRVFEDIDALAAGCYFRDCQHDQEPRCAVKQAVEAGRLQAARLGQFHKLKREAAALSAQLEAQARDAKKREARAGARAIRAFYKDRHR